MSHFRNTRVDSDRNLDAERCIVELQRGREVTLVDDNGLCTIRLVETLDATTLKHITETGDCKLLLSPMRAQVLGGSGQTQAAVINLPASTRLARILSLAGLGPLQSDVEEPLNWQPQEDARATAALRLIQQAAVLPALLLYTQPVSDRGVLQLSVTSAYAYRADTASLIELSCAQVPLATADHTSLRVFREAHGTAEHVAMTVGTPDMSKPVDVRVHSSCFTGDIMGSLKCDCGEQLQGAIATMARTGGGVLLYISQEGRGIGLASKLRAYQLQAQGLDTIEANQYLGFSADARRYQAAATMLRALNIRQIRLITNNPEKIDALRSEGIDVVARLPSVATVNVHNARYLETKRERSGHLSMESVG